MTSSFLPALAVLSLMAAALLVAVTPDALLRGAKRTAEGLALFALAIGAACLGILWRDGPSSSQIFGFAGVGLQFRIDAISVPLLLLIGFIGWIVVRFSRTYLDGEPNQQRFFSWLCGALAAVMLMVTAGNLGQLVAASMAASLCLNRLLLFYPQRTAARRAARKQGLAAGAAEAALVITAGLLWTAHGTGDIEAILADLRANGPTALDLLAAAFLAAAAILKSAQFPLQGWLTEVMEAPTPVSALLHAGIVNAGGFLLIRFAELMLAAPGALAALVIVGGLSALLGGLVMLTQPAVKTSLAWSTVAQMGFMLLQCGLGLYALALLHIVAHSLYKAHAFLSSGGAVERIAASARPGPVATPSIAAVGRAFLAAFAIFGLIGLAFGFHHKAPQAVALGALLIFGIAYLFAQGLASAAPAGLTRRVVGYAILASTSYFTLHAVAIALTAGAVPRTPPPDPLGWVLMATALLSFGLVAFAQSTFPLWSTHPAVAGLRVHLSNGLYANALFDRAIGAWTSKGLK